MGKGLLGILARPRSRDQAPLRTEDLLRLLCEQMPAVVWTTDPGLLICSIYGRAGSEAGADFRSLIGLHVGECFGNDSAEADPVQAHREALEGFPASLEFRWDERIYKGRVGPRFDRQGRIAGVVGIALDVTEQHRAVQARLESEQRYRQLFEEALDVIFTLDLEGRFTAVNKAARRVSGYRPEELIGSNISRLLEPAAYRYVQELIQRALGGETMAQFELPILARDGRRVLLDVSARLQFEKGRPVGIQGIARDITERKQLEERVLQAQKLEALGELAGGVAHDFNNLLSAILGHADLLQLNPKDPEAVRKAAEVIIRAGERAQRLAARLLGFAGRGKYQNVSVDLHALLSEVIGLLEPTLPKAIVLLTRYEAQPAVTMGDPGQLHQVFLNLALNARDAMPEGGTLVFRTENVEAPAEAFRDLGVASPGRYVKISVCDTGVGILPEHLPHLFEPFFTTKSAEGKTGMGLAMVYGIVKNHGGAIEVSSQPGCGTIFSVYLPAAPEQAAAPAAPAAQRPVPESASILVIDDEEVLGRAAASMLESAGYRAACADPLRAVEMVRAAPQAFDLVLLDVLMPGMPGEACFRALRAVRPDLRVVITSGYARDRAVQELLDAGAVGFVPKPYSFQRLTEAVRKALGA